MSQLKVNQGGIYYDVCVNPLSFYKSGAWHNFKSGDQVYFNGQWNPISCSIIILEPFDYAVLRYQLVSGGGTDLDTFTGIVNAGIPYDNDWVGFGQGNPKVPAGSSTPYLTWGGDNTTNNGVEAVLVNFKSITDVYTALDIVKIKMNAVWYGSLGSGNIQVQLQTYLGGTMQQNGFDFENVGGNVVDNLTIYRNVHTQSHSSSILNSDNVGNVTYDVATKKATLI